MDTTDRLNRTMTGNVMKHRLGRRGLVLGAAGAGSAAVLAACAPAGQGTAGEPPAAQSKPAGAIAFWQWGVSYVGGFDQLAAEFGAQHGGARVEHTRPDGYDDKIKVTVAAGSGAPDVYLMRGNNFKQWAQDGLAIDLTAFANRDKAAAADLKTMHKGFYDYYHHQGRLHGAPWDLSTISVAYSLEAIESRGLKPPSELGAAWNWETFTDYAKRLTPGDGGKYGVDAVPGIETGFYNWVVANGGDYWSADYARCTVNSPAFVEAAEAYMALGSRLAVSPPRAWVTEQTTGLPHRANLLSNGQVAMQTAGDWYFGWYDRTAGFRWDVVPMPVSPRTGRTGSIANYRGLSVAPTSQNRDLAWAWIAYLLTRPVQDRIPPLMGEVPARMDSIDQVYLNPAQAPSPKSRRLLKAAIDATKPLPAHPRLPYAEINSATNALQQDAYDGKKPVREAVAEIQDKLTALLGAGAG